MAEALTRASLFFMAMTFASKSAGRGSGWLVAVLALAAACARPVEVQDEPPSRAETRQFHSDAFAFRLSYPSELVARRAFKGSYLANDAWKTYAPEGSQGVPVIALVLRSRTRSPPRSCGSASAIRPRRCAAA